jgi:hypothetical protein
LAGTVRHGESGLVMASSDEVWQARSGEARRGEVWSVVVRRGEAWLGRQGWFWCD